MKKKSNPIKECLQYNISVEGENCELLYFEHLKKLINECEKAKYKVNFFIRAKNPSSFAKSRISIYTQKGKKSEGYVKFFHVQDIEDYYDKEQLNKFKLIIDDIEKAKKEAEKSDESEADSADEEDKISDDMIGRYVSQGYENPSFGFAINLPDTYTLENRNNVALNDADIVESSNSEGTYDYLKSLISLGSAVVFSAEDGNTYIELNIQNAAVLDKTATWDEEKNIAENSVMTEEDAKKLMGEDAQVTEFQNNVEEITFLGEKHYAAQYTFKNYDVSYYGVTVFLVNEQDSQYMLAVNIIGVDLNVVDQADQFFSVYTE